MCNNLFKLLIKRKNEIYLNFFTGNDILNYNEMNRVQFMSGQYKIMNITRLIKIEDTTRLKISLEGFSFNELKIYKIEASCIHFNDIKNIK